MTLKAVTFDFWSTLVDGEMTPDRLALRVARLQAALVRGGYACTAEELADAVERSLRRVDDDARETLIDVGPQGRWAILAAELGIPDGMIAYKLVEQVFADMTLEPVPEAMPHVHAAVHAMQRAGYRLAVICNTGMVGGQILREVLKRHGLFEYFELTVFSNEFGVSKPHPSIFAHTLAQLGGVTPSEALHVGDLEELDVEGARRAGLHSARYVPGTDGRIETDADFVVTDWRSFGDQVEAYASGLRA
ncbi:MAG TPA: HAD family hydrolase [Chloroflexota bacterium]|nr:HAD family hydrolase [Chloroflexota bacterium]